MSTSMMKDLWKKMIQKKKFSNLFKQILNHSSYETIIPSMEKTKTNALEVAKKAYEKREKKEKG